MSFVEWKHPMRRSETCLALAFITAMLVSVPACAAATGGERLHVEFRVGMPAFVQTLRSGIREADESSVQAYARNVASGEAVGTLVGYAVRPAPAGCDKPDLPCPARRAALPDDRAYDLPEGFFVEMADEPEVGDVRHELRAVEVFSDSPGSWVNPRAGRSPYQPYGAGTAYVMATQAGKLRPGALAQADCFDGMRLCAIRITYSRDLRVNFLSTATDEPLARQVRAVDAFMRSVIRPGPLPEPRVGSASSQAGPSPAQPAYFRDLPRERIRVTGGFPR